MRNDLIMYTNTKYHNNTTATTKNHNNNSNNIHTPTEPINNRLVWNFFIVEFWCISKGCPNENEWSWCASRNTLKTMNEMDIFLLDYGIHKTCNWFIFYQLFNHVLIIPISNNFFFLQRNILTACRDLVLPSFLSKIFELLP